MIEEGVPVYSGLIPCTLVPPLLRGDKMNAIDGLYNSTAAFLEKVSAWIPEWNPPWHKLTEKWAFMEQYIKQANVLFPLDSLLTIAGLIVTFLGIMLIIWGIKFIRDMLPF